MVRVFARRIKMHTTDITGAWILESFEIQTLSGASLNKQNSDGILIYDQSGVMSVAINSKGTNTESQTKTMVFYSGRWRIDGDEIVHEVTNASDVELIGRTLRRSFECTDNRLQLIAADPDVSTTTQAVLTWVKFGS